MTVTNGNTGNQSELLAGASRFRQQAAEVKDSDPRRAAQLERLADGLEKGFVENAVAIDLEAIKVRYTKWTDDWRRHGDWYHENGKSIITLSQSAQRNLILINAGAAIALLSFMGNLLTKDVDIAAFVSGVAWFASGVALGALTSALAYLVQLYYGKPDNKGDRVGQRLHIAAIILGFVTLLTFVGGCMVTYQGFRATTRGSVEMSAPEKRNNPPPKRPPVDPPSPIVPSVPARP